MGKLKRPALGIALFALLLAGGGFALLFVAGRVGESSLEAWVGKRLKAVVAQSLKPTLDFESLDYQAPRTVVLSGVTLTADDPDRPGERVAIIRAKTLQFALAELPSEGEPLKLSSANIDGAVIRLIENEAGGLLGFSDMTKPTASDDPEQLLSEVLQISEIIIDDSTIEYDTRGDGVKPMHIDKIDTVVRIDPGNGGVYGLNVMLEREGVFDFGFKGGLDLDRMALQIEEAAIDLQLAREQDHYLPPQLQALLKTYELTGAMALTCSGKVDLNDPLVPELQIGMGLSDAYGTFEGYRLPIKSLNIEAMMSGGLVSVQQLDAQLLGGTIEATGTLGLHEPMLASVNIGGEGLVLEQMLPPKEPGGKPSVQGSLDLQAKASAPLTKMMTQLGGSGEIKLSEGRIAGLPVISSLIAFMESEGEIDQITGKAKGTDTGHIVFELRGDHAYLSQCDIDASWYAVHGRGKMFLDERVAMNVNAGPLTKVGNALGVLGRLVGGVTDNALVYRVRGNLDALSVVPVPLVGGIVGAPGDDESAGDFLKTTER